MLFFKNRTQAGELLAKELEKYKGEKNAIIALGDGSVSVAEAITKSVPAIITMLVTEAIALPGETDPIGYIDQDRTFVPNKLMNPGQLQDFMDEYRTYIEQQKMEKFSMITALAGGDDVFPHSKLHGYNIIMVSDGFSSGPLLDSIVDLLKPIRINKFIVAVPVACITTMDRINHVADEVDCLGVAEFYMGVNHYYEDNTLPEHKAVIKTVTSSITNWTY